MTAVLELESYLKQNRVRQIGLDDNTTQMQSIVAGVQAKQDATMEMLTQIMGRLEN